MKNILDRKNAKNVLDLANKGLSIRQISLRLGIWYNVANYLVKGLKAEGLVNCSDKLSLSDVLKSSRKQVIIDMFNENKTISQKSIVNRIKLSRLPADMLEDLRELEKQNLIEVTVKGNSKLFIIK